MPYEPPQDSQNTDISIFKLIFREKKQKIEKQKTRSYNIPANEAVGENRMRKTVKPREDYSKQKKYFRSPDHDKSIVLSRNHDL